MRDTDFSRLLFVHLEEREHNNVYKNLNKIPNTWKQQRKMQNFVNSMKIWNYLKNSGMLLRNG